MAARMFLLAAVQVLASFTVTARLHAQGDWLAEFHDELFDPVAHTHFSQSGTPYIHPFSIEPPQIHQDVFFIYKYTNNTIEGSNEHETEVHVDWGLTKRIGILFAVPLVGVEDATGTQSVGFGDLEIAPRFMLIERDCFILASNFFMTIPTGDANRNLGAGETVLSPFITTWHDLGNWNTLLTNFGPQIGTVTGNTSLSYTIAFAHTWVGPAFLESETHEHEDVHGDGSHFEPGTTSLHVEVVGETELTGDQNTFIEILPGVSYSLAEHAEIRFGVLLPISTTQRFDAQYFFAFDWIY